MSYNLFIAYDLMSPGQNYDAIRDAIKSLGAHHQFQFSLFYVHTHLTPHQAYDTVAAAMDANDRLVVINAAHDLGAVFSNWDNPPVNAINTIWVQQ